MHDYDEDIKPQEFAFKYDGKEYVLREASADAGRQWRNANMRGASMKDGRVTMPDSTADSESVLVSLCTFELFDEPRKERVVTLLQVRLWPDRLVTDLSRRAREMSGLDKDAKKMEAEAKNSPNGAAATSG